MPSKTDAAGEKPAARKRANPQKWVRNLTLAQVAFRIGDPKEGRRVELKPRGHRGDLAMVSKDDLSKLVDVDSIYEVITDTEAKEIIGKQTTNQQAYHPALNVIRNSKGEAYEKAVVVATDLEAQGITVAHIEGNDPVSGNKKNIAIDRVSVTDVLGPERVAVPGSTEYVDQVARQKGTEGPTAGGINRVVIEPRQKG